MPRRRKRWLAKLPLPRRRPEPSTIGCHARKLLCIKRGVIMFDSGAEPLWAGCTRGFYGDEGCMDRKARCGDERRRAELLADALRALGRDHGRDGVRRQARKTYAGAGAR